jgi:transcriptional regulator with XRE-family HTH domain
VAKHVQSPEHEVMERKRRSRARSAHASFGKRLSALMEERDLGVRDAAGIAGVSPSTVVSWRSGAAPEDYVAVKRLARGLGTTLSFLLTGEDDARPAGTFPAIAEVFDDGGPLFDGYAKITIQRLLPKAKPRKEDDL